MTAMTISSNCRYSLKTSVDLDKVYNTTLAIKQLLAHVIAILTSLVCNFFTSA